VAHYRFFHPNLPEMYITQDTGDVTPSREKAGIFTENDWHEWGRISHYKREPLSEDEEMALIEKEPVTVGTEKV